MSGEVIQLKARIGSGPEREFVGRFAWALNELAKAGKRGVTPIDRPGPRWSHYVHILRTRDRLPIETVTEKHRGPYPGRHARYVLRGPVQITDRVRA